MTNAITYNPSLIELKELAAVLITGLLLITGWQYIKEAIALVLMKLYEIFVQQNPIKL